MTRETILTLALLLATTAAAETGWTPPPEPQISAPGSDSDHTPVQAQHWTGICARLPDGRIITHTAFGRDRATAHRQCKEKLEGDK